MSTKGLKRSEIKADKIYRCLLSERNVLIEKVYSNDEDTLMIVARAYNFTKGKYQEIEVRDS